MKCVASVEIEEDSRCLKKCSGLLVTTFDKYQVKEQTKQFIETLSGEYWKYKGFYNFPKNSKGKNKYSKLKLSCKQKLNIFQSLKWKEGI